MATHIGVSLAIFGILTMLDGCLIFLLSETKGREIPDTLDEAEKFWAIFKSSKRLSMDRARNKFPFFVFKNRNSHFDKLLWFDQKRER